MSETKLIKINGYIFIDDKKTFLAGRNNTRFSLRDQNSSEMACHKTNSLMSRISLLPTRKVQFIFPFIR